MRQQVFSSSIDAFHDERELRQRISAEFHEMPGLVLTLAQASRLFSIDLARCERVLGSLVQHGVLAVNGRAFARAGTGRHWA